MTLRSFLPLLVVLPLCGCAPTVNVAVPKPVVIDVNMKVDVTSRNETPTPAASKGNTASTGSGTGTVTVAPSSPADTKDAALDGAAEDAHSLSGEVQSLKDQRLIGEGADGYLAVHTVPAGKVPSGETYADYVKRIVDEENRARRTLYGRNASQHGTPVDTEASEAGKRLAQTAYPGEWLQDASGKWKQK